MSSLAFLACSSLTDTYLAIEFPRFADGPFEKSNSPSNSVILITV